MGCCPSKKPNETSNSMGGTFSNTKGIEVTTKGDTQNLIRNDQNRPLSTQETTLKAVKQQHLEKVLDSVEYMIENEHLSSIPVLKLLPHQHTLFCERKQRVCTSVGRLQEYEIIEVENVPEECTSFVWVRRPPTSHNSPDHSADEVMEESENEEQYKLTKRDVGFYITVRMTTEVISNSQTTTTASSSSSSSSSSNSRVNYTPSLGPVLPGPPRILDFVVRGAAAGGEEGPLSVGSGAVASYEYIGGFEGVSEHWWMRIHPDGKREQITTEADAAKLVAEGTDTRLYVITAGDVGCTLKAKCRPVRSDGVKGEIFTSKNSDVIVAEGCSVSEASGPDVVVAVTPEAVNDEEHQGEVGEEEVVVVVSGGEDESVMKVNEVEVETEVVVVEVADTPAVVVTEVKEDVEVTSSQAVVQTETEESAALTQNSLMISSEEPLPSGDEVTVAQGTDNDNDNGNVVISTSESTVDVVVSEDTLQSPE